MSTFSASSASRNSLVFGSFTSNAFTTVSLPSANFAASAERSAPSKLLARKRVVIGARNRSVHRAAVPPQRRPDRTNTRPSRALSASTASCPNRKPASGLLVACVPRVLPGAVMLHRFPEQVFVHRAENLIGEVEASRPCRRSNCEYQSLPYAFLWYRY